MKGVNTFEYSNGYRAIYSQLSEWKTAYTTEKKRNLAELISRKIKLHKI